MSSSPAAPSPAAAATPTPSRSRLSDRISERDAYGTALFFAHGSSQKTQKDCPLLCREELLALLRSDQVRNYPWIADEGQRRLRFRELINSGDRAQLMGMIGALHRHRREQLAAGRKFHQSDENFLSDAQKLLNAEFALVFGLEPREVNDFIRRELENFIRRELENNH